MIGIYMSGTKEMTQNYRQRGKRVLLYDVSYG